MLYAIPMNASALDPRIQAFDLSARLAEESLRGHLEGDGWRYFQPKRVWAGSARVSLRGAPTPDAAQVTEALPGEALELLWENGDGWARVRTVHDGYLGWTEAVHVVYQFPAGEELRVGALRAHAYAGPRVSQPIVAELCLGAALARAPGEVITEEHRRWQPVFLPSGAEAWVQEVILSPIPDGDVADLALRFLGTPYVWGGRSAWGLDCSGLTQLVFRAFGRSLPRDADQQQAALPVVDAPTRGDLAFFPGHVGIMLDERRMVHANATHMAVTIEEFGVDEYGVRLAQGCTGFGRWTA